MRVDYRVYKTRDGKHVKQGDPRAAFLAYPAGRELPNHVVAELTDPETETDVKQAAPAEDKQAPKSSHKGRGRPPLPRDADGNILRG